MTRLITPLIFALITITPGAFARRGFGGGIAGVITDLDLDPIDKTRFCFSVIFALIAAFQLFQSLRILFRINKQNTHHVINTGIPFVIAILLTTSTLVAFYVMLSVDIAIDDNLDSLYFQNFTPGFYVSIAVLPELAEIFFLAGLLIVIRHRAYTNEIVYPPWKALLDGVFILLLLVCAVTQAGINGTPIPEGNANKIYEFVKIYSAFTHLYVAFYILIAINIVASTVFVKQRSLRLDMQDKVLRSLAIVVCPWIVIRAMYELIFDILYSVPTDPLIPSINYRAVELADLIIYGFSFAFAVGAALRLGVHPVNPKGMQQ